jgi:hypothetical protein
MFIPFERRAAAYACGLLNSELLDLWYGIRGKTPRDVWRNYEPKRMKEIPYRHVQLGEKETRGPRLKELKTALRKHEMQIVRGAVLAITSDLRTVGDAALGAEAPEAIEAARALEEVVRAIADNRQALLPHRDRFPALSRVVKDPWSTEVVDPDAGAFVEALPKAKRASVRVDPELSVTIDTDGALGRATIEEDALVFRHRRQVVARIDGPVDKLMLLSEIWAMLDKPLPGDLLKAEVPRDVVAFREGVEARWEQVAALLAEGRVLVEAAERLVCALYAIPLDLEEEVIAHAVARSGSIALTGQE